MVTHTMFCAGSEGPFAPDDIRERGVLPLHGTGKYGIGAKGYIKKLGICNDIPYRSGDSVESTADYPDRNIRFRLHKRDLSAFDLLITRFHHLICVGKVDPELEPTHLTAHRFWHLLVNDSRTRGHPLDIPGLMTPVFPILSPWSTVPSSM